MVIFFFHTALGWGQSDSTQISTTTEASTPSISPKKKGNFVSRYFKKDYPSPRKAVILTAIIPGLGQIYNKKHWYIKLPLVYGAFGGLIYSIKYNRKQYLFLKKEHRYLVDGLPETVSQFEGRVSAEVLKNARDKHDKWLQMSYIGIGLAYVLTAAEAYTTAHLLSFDVNDDLSVQVKPSVDFVPNEGTVVGVGVNFYFGK
ncbi:MAG TPA: hypothetical protein ENJ53_04715 [Phaeodactylibacter sp.]|nr:hypothetical protein [Phaeodactylibacter sp.]